MKVTGLAGIFKALNKETDALEGAMGAALFQEGEAIMAKSVPLCPVRTGRLVQSHKVERPAWEGDDLAVRLGYGTEYALPVHELEGEINWSKPGSGAKYLQRPFEAALRGFKDRLAKRVRELWARGVKLMPGGAA